jgi:hypothetical protein
VDACEPPSQLQEALKESTEVDVEYNLPPWVPETRVNKTKRRFQPTFCAHSLNIQCAFREHSVTPRSKRERTFREPSSTLLPVIGLIINTCFNMHSTFGAHSLNIQCTFREHSVTPRSTRERTFRERSSTLLPVIGLGSDTCFSTCTQHSV